MRTGSPAKVAAVLLVGLVAAAVVIVSRRRPLPAERPFDPPVVDAPADPPAVVPVAADDDPSWDPAATYPVDPPTGMLSVPVTWQGRPYRFVVDTGSTVNAVDAAAFADLPARSGEPNGDGGKYALCDPPALAAGPFLLADGGPVARLDLVGLFGADMPSPPVIGVLGMAAVGRMTIQVDFAGHRFRFLPAPARRPGRDWGTAVRLGDAYGSLRTVVVRHGTRTWTAVVDTGCFTDDGVVTPAVFDQLADGFPLPAAHTWSAAGGPAAEPARRRWLAGVTLGDDVGPYGSVTVRDGGRGAADSLVGPSLLSRNPMVTIDPVGRVMYVRRDR